ncbi:MULTISPECIES: segregation/condensation protein A [Clostridium]|uniref:Segregation and condensation protein A n=2 Tax=Clostridium TaxID=1485 RepID=A0A151AQC2_9CLOT|nr:MULTISPECIES: segregation/condensation protein A [Clostridium]MBE6078991.1 segregation/condensation protein A [Clostridium lundense]KYH29834.1 segregation and condensation protein A [Clostridium colicanis DSM 13634]MBE6042708.1 segregation/condensation protein A [Clostridium thermopalmarium]PRR75215.1 Segregation and condensation protein A [Clostridium thermopalmarium DSM 5974]PVZ27971.1 condensin subunit ScpA [Clostridium thermopalmarium DSM 5974]
MSISIKIENFEGPFDLLLYLIKKNKMEIYDIKIHDITTQYLDYINNMKEMDLDITSEFIVIAATLLEIKSKMLLPKENIDNEDTEEDPRKYLMDKLIEYKKFKKVADWLKEKEKTSEIMFSKKPEIIEDNKATNYNTEELLQGITILKLFNIYNNLITIYNNKMNTGNTIEREIPIDRFKVEDKIEELSKRIHEEKRIIFSKIMNECKNKIEIVVSFLALLELIKLRIVSVVQECNFEEIYIEEIKNNEE